MRTVWKFPLPEGDVPGEFTIGLPRGAKLLLFAPQTNGIMRSCCLWAEVDPAQPKRSVRFFVAGTGHEVPDGWIHVASFADDRVGNLVFHLYRRREDA